MVLTSNNTDADCFMLRLKAMKEHNKNRSRRLHHIRNSVFFVLATCFFVAGTLTIWMSTLEIPDLSSFSQIKVVQSTKIYDRTGTVLLYDVHQDIKRTVVPIDKISTNIKNASVSIEDAQFYQHHGIRPTAIARAILANILIKLHLSNGYTQGGSTITQQVVKNSLLTQDRTFTRKIKEWVLALKLERILNKEEILSLYLNGSSYGGSIYGVEEASLNFFDKHASDVDLAEAAYIAALPQGPSYYSPYGNHKDQLELRKNLVLKQMHILGYITDNDYQSAMKEVVIFKPLQNSGITAPHFVLFIKDYLTTKYGEQAIEEQGFKVTTTLDAGLQVKAEEIVKKHALDNAAKFHATNASLVTIDPKTGQILTMVGSRNYFDKDIDGNVNVALAKRQPGSTFKPFVYATAFEKGYRPETTVFDVPTQFSTACAADNFSSIPPCYSPNDYDGRFRGPMTLRNALAQSINIPAVKVLYLAGIKDSLQTAKDMGITTLTDASRYGLTLVLGGGEVTLLDMTSAYGVFANEGVRNPYTGILKVENSVGQTIEEYKPQGISILDPDITRNISDILNDNTARTPIYGPSSSLYFSGHDVAVKTGTTNNYKDAWIVGYTPSLVVGAWVGNNDNTPMDKKVAGYIAGPLWHEFMALAISKYPNEAFTPPAAKDMDGTKPVLRGIWQGNDVTVIDRSTGDQATDTTLEQNKSDKIITNTHTILHWVDRSNPNGPVPTSKTDDPQYSAWEYGVQQWVANNGPAQGVTLVIPR
jgi:1A family penicillin-binding protein